MQNMAFNFATALGARNRYDNALGYRRALEQVSGCPDLHHGSFEVRVSDHYQARVVGGPNTGVFTHITLCGRGGYGRKADE